MRQELRRFQSAILLILAFTLGLGAQLLQAQVSVSPGRYRFGATIAPSTNDGAALGTASLSWSDLFLASGGVINWANGEITITETDANTLTLAGGVFAMPAGSATAPSLNFGTANNGLYAAGTDSIDITVGGVQVLSMSTDGTFNMPVSTSRIRMNSNTYFGVESDNVFQQGIDAASPVAQTLKGADARAGTDTDTAGGNYTFAAGRGTGTGNPGAIFFQTGATNTSGTGAGPLTTRLEIASTGRLVIASHTRFNVASSTTGTGTALLGTNAPIGQVAAPYVWVSAIASDGTAIWIPAWR